MTVARRGLRLVAALLGPAVAAAAALAATTATTAALLAAAAAVPAAAATQPASTTGSWTAPLATATAPDVVLAGRFTGPPAQWAALDSVTVAVTWAGDDPLPSGCTVPSPRTVPLAGTGETRTFEVPVVLGCNGDYRASARTVTGTGECPQPMECPALADLPVAVAAPGPAPTGLDASADDDEPSPVRLAWRPPAHPPADSLRTYRVERSTGGGPFTTVATTGPGATSWQDDGPPGSGGTFAYRVVALRRGPGGQPVASSPSAPATVHVVAPPAPGGPGGGPGGDPGSGGPGGTGGTGAPVPDGGPGPGGGPVPDWPGGLDLAPPGGGTLPAGDAPAGGGLALSPPTTGDAGYRPTLDYGDAMPAGPGGRLTRVPAEEVAARSATTVERVTEEEDPRRVLLPVAAAMALLVGAAQLHHLGRRAKAVPADAVPADAPPTDA